MGNELRVLPASVGYGIVIGIGGIFALFMLSLTWLQNRYTRFSTHHAEEFNTASRSVKPGLISAGIVSSWTWSATLLTSSTFAYEYGVCGPMWYAAMGTLQILLFGLIAIKIKTNAPGAHTMPEIVLARHGKIAHLTYLYYGLATNMLVGACLVLGGAQVVEALTGMNVYAATFLIPAVVAAYVIAGGLRSTFIADYTHTVILFIAILVFGFLITATSDLVGSPGRLYDLLQEASRKMPIERNTDGSYLAFRSVGGLIFAFDLFVAGFTTVWLDQAYWQRAIASKPETSVKAYILGGIAWYGIPFGFATVMGLGCAALTGDPRFPTYPNPLSAEQVGAGLSAPATAIALLGKGGAVLMLILLFMAVTSSTSAELIAVSSLLTFDVYKTYFRPNTISTDLVRVSHWAIVVYALVLAAFCCVLNAVGISLTWVLTVLGVIVGGAALPVGMILLWKPMSTVAAIGAPWIGLLCGVIVWFITAWKRNGSISVASTGDTTNALAGNIASFGGGFIMAVVLSYAFPKKHESPDLNAITGIAASIEPPTLGPEQTPPTAEKENEKVAKPVSDDMLKSQSLPAFRNELVDYLESSTIEPMDPELARKGTRIAVVANTIFFFGAVILVPFTLFGTSYIYSKPFFTGWVVVSFIWIWTSVMICVVYPVVESMGALRSIMGGLWGDMKAVLGRRKEKVAGIRDAA
ncbi:solute symporter family transporter [Penicillium subrubescens]|uniref:Urea active transporter n=1 Tax=Penicillium subrubescens TaxID=1316194 RepID=A0A1Q5TBM8_9EURO|nr:solute symporter family transporter [Penicillium subrubescens]KAJ5892134.1 solute symporter family transporter [Penicillium subrubescens]OKO97617.1 Urea active transporter [Penicillium subrubescens]